MGTVELGRAFRLTKEQRIAVLALSARRLMIVVVELGLVVLSMYLAYWLRFDGDIPEYYLDLLKRMLPFVVTTRALIFIPFGLYRGLWRYTGLWDLRNIVAAVSLGTGGLYIVGILLVSQGPRYPRSIFVIDAMLMIFFLSGIRLTYRVYRALSNRGREKGVLVYGAGDAGEMVVRDMRNNPFYRMDPVGFIDDDIAKVGHRIHGVPILGTRGDLQTLMSRFNIKEVLIAMPKARPSDLRQIIQALEPFKVPITTLPSFREIMDRKVTVDQIRTLSFEDLLQRAPVGLDPAPVRDLITGRRVMVTGAGGSIGAELCRQILRMKPDTLVLFERHEPSLYAIHKGLGEFTDSKRVARVADVTDRRAVAAALAEDRPDIVFHAAAHKHVPLMEANVCEAVKNNVAGTRIVAQEACSAGVERFLLISTDKAVDPSSVMGATKRVSEILIRDMSRRRRGCLNIVRFGNVLGSNGSVVPLFMEQIRAGGPVTVTHPDMRRFFMLLPEAVHLVLHAATLGESGATYVLDMGDQFKLVDLARHLIRLSGFIPDEEIPIEFVGPRPGEKLAESLAGAGEIIEPSAIDRILHVMPGPPPGHEWLETRVLALEAAAAGQDTAEVVSLLREIVPTFEPWANPPKDRPETERVQPQSVRTGMTALIDRTAQ